MAERFRDWVALVYPDSAPENWTDILDKQHLSFGVSPLHDKNLDPEGDEFKPHWHLYLKFSGVKTYKQIQEYIKDLNCTRPEPVSNPISMVRYFIHLDHPQKQQFAIDDIQCFGGFEIFASECFKLGAFNVNEIMSNIQDWIIKNQISEYKDLWEFSKDFPQWRYVLNLYNCHGINRLLNSVRNSNRFHVINL